MSSSTWEIVTSSLPQIITAAVKYTIPLTLISFVLGLILALITAMVRLSLMRGPFQIVRGLFLGLRLAISEYAVISSIIYRLFRLT